MTVGAATRPFITAGKAAHLPKKVLVVTYAHVVPPTHYGGSERMVDVLCRGLAAMDIEVDLIAGVGSRTYGGQTFGLPPPSTDLGKRLAQRARFEWASLKSTRRADIVHSFFVWPEYHGVVNLSSVPVVYHQQNAFNSADVERMRSSKRRGAAYMIAISADQVSNVRGHGGPDVRVIANCTNTDLICPPEKPSRGYLAFLGRLTHEKGADIAIEIAERAGMPLKLAGIVPEQERGAVEFFEAKIKPRLRGAVEFVGPITDKEKSDFLGNALAMLMPNRWREPFGIVMAEALAAGVPIIGTALGSIPEVVRDGETGFVCANVDEMVRAVGHLSTISRERCREDCVARFSEQAFMRNILALYADVLASSAH